jgi:hypothetical protein
MESAGLVVDALGRVRDMVRNALGNLSPEELLAPQTSYRVVGVAFAGRSDTNFSGLMEQPQLWIADEWYARFNMPPNPRDYGSGNRHAPA